MRVDSILLSFRLTPTKEQERQCCPLEGPAGRHSSAIGAPILPIQASSCGAGDPSLEVHKLLRLTCKTAPNQQAEASHLVTVGTTLMEMQFMSRTLIRMAALNKSYYIPTADRCVACMTPALLTHVHLKLLSFFQEWNSCWNSFLESSLCHQACQLGCAFPRWPDPLAKACFVKIDGKPICSHLIWAGKQ